MEDRSLDEFLDDGSDESGSPGESEPSEAAGSEESEPEASGESESNAQADEESVAELPDDPEPATSSWTPDGEICEGCGESVDRRWDDGGQQVCRSCKEW
ncbi:hypothetical protein BRC87_05760 [Halobacteriales archaeon QS_4_66_20]|nr:MAG: hypothetical protein BRC87_05760 [Halobacteriales archaeon QS_4_66_20]